MTNQKSDALIFSILAAPPTGLCETPSYLHVPLTVRAMAELQTKKVSLDLSSYSLAQKTDKTNQFLSSQKLRDMIIRLEDAWLVSYRAYFLLLFAERLRSYLRLLLDSHSPKKVWLPHAPDFLESVCVDLTEDSFRCMELWAAYRVVVEETEHLDTSFYKENLKFNNLSQIFMTEKPGSHSFSESVLYRIRRIILSFKKLGNIKPTFGQHDPPLLFILASKASRWLLESELEKKQMRYRIIDGTSFQSAKKPIVIPKSAKSGEGILTWLDHELLSLEEKKKSITDFLGKNSKGVIVTDQEYSSEGRLLINGASHNGWHVAIIPEGRAHRNLSLMADYRWWHHISDQSTRCVLSQSDYRFWSQYVPHQEILATGYLGNTSRYTKLISHWAFQLARVAIRIFYLGIWRRAGIVLVDFSVHSASVGFRPLHHFLKYAEAIASLISSGYQVIIKTRDIGTANILKKQFPHSLVFNFIPWQLLLEISDVLIQTDSSTGIEALELSRPVIVFKYNEDVPASEVWAYKESDCVIRVSNPEEVVHAVRKLSSSGKVGFSEYSDFFTGDASLIVNWIQNKLK